MEVPSHRISEVHSKTSGRKHLLQISYWCLVGNGWEWGNGMIMTSDYGSFPHSLRLAPVRYGVPPIKKVPEMASHGIIQPTVPNGAFRGFSGLHHGMLHQEMVEVLEVKTPCLGLQNTISIGFSSPLKSIKNSGVKHHF